MRQIDADALYETMCHIWDRSDSEEFEQAVFETIENAPTIEVPTWILCSERLPEEGEKVLLVDEDGDIDIGRMIRTNNGCLFDASTWLYDIDEWQAWMPLPEPYRGDKV